MSKKTWLVLGLVACTLCMLPLLCGLGYYGVRSLSAREDSSKQATLELSGLLEGRQGTEGALRLAGDLPPTLDPAMVQDSSSAEYVVHLFSGLVTLDRDLEVVPDLAQEWEVSADGRTYRFQLRAGIAFADGTPITAEDVKYSLERASDPDQASSIAETYLGDIEGWQAFAAGDDSEIAGIQIEASDRLSIRIDGRKAYFLAKLTYPTAFVVDSREASIGESDWVKDPNVSGPFTLAEIGQDGIVLERNENYWDPPALERVVYVTDEGLPMTMYENDELDLVTVPSSDVARVLDPENPLHAEYTRVSELSVQYIGFNMSRPPFDDMRVRQAFALAIDQEKIAELVLSGTALPADRILPPLLVSDQEPLTVDTMGYDPERARALLEASDYGGDDVPWPDVVLSISGTSGQMPAVTNAVVHMLQENLGVEVLVEQVAWQDFLNDMNQRRYQMFSSGWIADYPDPQNFLDVLFHSDSQQNHTGYANAQVDELLVDAQSTTDANERTRLYREAEQIILQEAAWVPLTYGVRYSLAKPNVKGFHPSASLYPWLKEVYIAR